MKKLFLIALVAVFSLPVFGQGIEITPYTGYLLSGNLQLYDGELVIEHGQDYGGIIDIPIQRNVQVELAYNYLSSELRLRNYATHTEEFLSDLGVHFYQAGALYERYIGKKVEGFTNVTLGAAQFSPTESKYSDDWRFTITAGLGAKIFFSKNIGIRLGARVLMPMYFASGGIYIGPGGGGFTLGAGTTLLMWDFTAGLTFRLGK